MNGKAASTYATSISNNPFRAIPRPKYTGTIAAIEPILIDVSVRLMYFNIHMAVNV